MFLLSTSWPISSASIPAQEKLTRQIAQAITDAINPAGVGVVMQAR